MSVNAVYPKPYIELSRKRPQNYGTLIAGQQFPMPDVVYAIFRVGDGHVLIEPKEGIHKEGIIALTKEEWQEVRYWIDGQLDSKP